MNENDKKILYHLIAVAVALTWGCTFVNSKILILHGMSPEEISPCGLFTVLFSVPEPLLSPATMP